MMALDFPELHFEGIPLIIHINSLFNKTTLIESSSDSSDSISLPMLFIKAVN
jgi:hypothetical protein